MKIHYRYEDVIDDQVYYRIQKELISLLRKYNYRFTVDEKRQFIKELSKIDGLRVDFDEENEKYVNFKQANFMTFLTTFLDNDHITIEQRNKKIRGKAVPITYIHVVYDQ